MRYFAIALCGSCLACLAPAAPAPFPTGSFQRGWDEPIDPDRDCKFVRGDNKLTVHVPGTYHDISPANGKMNAPRLLRDVQGDFVMQVRVSSTFRTSQLSSAGGGSNPYIGAGLVLMAEDARQTVKRFEFGTHRARGEERRHFTHSVDRVRAPNRTSSSYDQDGASWPLTARGKQAYLRIERQGDQFSYSMSGDGKEWQPVMPLVVPLPARLKVGVYAASTSREPITITFDQFKLERVQRADK